MRLSPFCFVLFCVLGLAAFLSPAVAETDDEQNYAPSTLVTAEILESKIAEVEATTKIPDEVRSGLVELYRKALSNLQTASSSEEAAASFDRAFNAAPAQIAALQDLSVPPPLETLGVELATPRLEIEQVLQKEQADLAAVSARRADFQRRLTYNQNQPTAISRRLGEAWLEQETVVAELKSPPLADQGAAFSQARRWNLETRYVALSSEINMLNQELLSQPRRLKLLKAKLDKADARVVWIGTRVKALSELVNRKRQLEAAMTVVQAEATRQETSGLDPLLDRLAVQNAELTRSLTQVATDLDALDRDETEANQLAKRVAADYRDIKGAVEASGLSRGLGQLLFKHRKSLPDAQLYTRQAHDREQLIAEVGVRRLRYREEARSIADPDRAVVEMELEISAEKIPLVRETLRELVVQRQALLQKALEADEFYLGQLRELDAAERKLLGSVRAFDAFLSEHLLWLRTAEPTRLENLIVLPDEVRQYVEPAIWSDLAHLLYGQITRSPVFWLILGVAIFLRSKRRSIVTAIERTAKHLGKPNSDSFLHTVRALALTLLAAAPWPLLLMAVGSELRAAAAADETSYAIGITLMRVALFLYVLRILHAVCMPQGLALAHFLWPKAAVRLLRVELNRLTWVFVPLLLLVRLAVDLNPAETGGTVAQLGSLFGYAALVFFFYRVFHPRGAILVHLQTHRETALLVRTHALWYPLLLLIPVGMVILALLGYMYSAAVLSVMLDDTLLMASGLIVLLGLVMRWLQLVRRHLAYEAVLDRRQASIEARQASKPVAGEDGGAVQFEEPDVDLASLSDESQELVRIAMIVIGLIGLYLIWSPALPALRILEDINLWHYTVTLDGEEKRLPINLADVGLALMYAIGIAVLAKRLPAVLEIILLRLGMSSASRYTVTTLVNYVVIGTGVLLILSTIGLQWSKLQWLVAAMGVGIGFGLQEIVANFISGLIILFERPIRVGDYVSVGDTDGVVTKIRIRATTVLNLDRKELLVPNKEFITGHLLNWSLSDQTTRVLLSVGIAYGSDVREAMRLLEEVAIEHEDVLDEPAPSVIFQAFGDNALTLVLRCVVDSINNRHTTISDLNLAIDERFSLAGIVIAFPQRDLHLDMKAPLQISIADERQDPAGELKHTPKG